MLFYERSNGKNVDWANTNEVSTFQSTYVFKQALYNRKVRIFSFLLYLMTVIRKVSDQDSTVKIEFAVYVIEHN